MCPVSCMCYRVLNVESMKEPEACALGAAVMCIMDKENKEKHWGGDARAKKTAHDIVGNASWIVQRLCMTPGS